MLNGAIAAIEVLLLTCPPFLLMGPLATMARTEWCAGALGLAGWPELLPVARWAEQGRYLPRGGRKILACRVN